MRQRIRAGLIAGVALALAALFAGVFRDGDAVRTPGPPEAGAAAAIVDPARSAESTEAGIAELEAKVASRPADATALTSLGLAYEQRARETGDPSFYASASAAYGRAFRLEPRSSEAATGLASVAASRHRFSEARRLARRAVELERSNADAYGILGDALVELGRYGAGFAAYNRMAALEPNLASFTRIAHARELLGKPGGAAAALRLAVEAGAASEENTAWALVQLGNLLADGGRPGPAAAAYRAALARFPGFVHARAGLARVAAARRRYDAAVAQYRRVVDLAPLPQYAVALSDVLRAAGRAAEARRADALVLRLARLLEAAGVRTELETALFDLDRGRHLAGALARARAAYAAAPSIHAEDVLAWALYRNGRCEEARAHSARALRLGTHDALKLFHRGMIERCLGNRAAARAALARAVVLNPHFSLRWAPVARDGLR
jgi:tetratricopeptide (TPR) repeat protein